MPKTLGFVLICYAVISLVVLSPAGPIVMLILTISLVGMPLALLLMAVPTLFLFLLIVSGIAFLLGSRRWLSYAAGAVIGGAVLTGIPYIVNQDLKRQVHELASRDLDAVNDVKVKRLAILVPKRPYSSEPLCGGLCQRILLNSSVEELIVVEADRHALFDLDMSGTLYRRYRADKCPVVKFEPGGVDFSPKNKRRQSGDRSPADLLTLQIMNGNCLGQSLARADSADAIVIREENERDAYTAGMGWDLWGWELKVGSLTLLQRQNGVFAATYRKTVVRYNPLFPILAPTVTGMAFNGFGRNQTGFYRRNAVHGADSIFVAAPDIGTFLADRLRFDLALHDDHADQQVRQFATYVLRPGLSDNGDFAPAIEILFTGIARDRNPRVADLDLAARLMIDRRLQLPPETAMTVRRIAEKRPEQAERLADSLFVRFAALSDKATRDLTKDEKVQLYRCAQAIGVLPKTAVQEHFAVIQRVAGDDYLREAAGPLLVHVSSFGQRGISIALFLIEESWRFRDPDRPVNNAWQGAYLPGLIALCRMGPAAQSALPRLKAMQAKKQIAMFGPYERLWEKTLTSFDGVPQKGASYCSF